MIFADDAAGAYDAYADGSMMISQAYRAAGMMTGETSCARSAHMPRHGNTFARRSTGSIAAMALTAAAAVAAAMRQARAMQAEERCRAPLRRHAISAQHAQISPPLAIFTIDAGLIS